MHISFSDNAKSIKNLQDDLKKDLDESDCLFDDDLNTLLGNCAEPWNVSTYFMLLRKVVFKGFCKPDYDY